ncbi:hypothetical protein NE865_09621 [Phthorimaea operculella]|nr:hypothetical protein NE865_09621 [Phthorimaea operculella]
MSTCKKCAEDFDEDGNGEVLCSQCNGFYHFRCSGLLESTYKNMNSKKKAAWRCVSCRQQTDTDSTSELLKEIKGIKSQLTTMQSGLDRANSGIIGIDSKILSIESRLDNLETRFVVIETNNKLLPTLDANLKKLESDFVAMQENERQRDQFCRLNNVEISGIPQKHGENLMSILNSITTTVGFQLRDTDIDTIHRVRRFTSAVDGRQGADPRPPAIIVRFCQRRRKDELVSAVRARRSITTADAGLPGPATPVYVNEHLTAANKLLLNQARELKKDLNFTYLWVKQCKIFMRKDDNSKVYCISSNADFLKLKMSK